MDTTWTAADYPSFARVRYDLVAGFIGEHTGGQAGGSADVRAIDRYTVLGPSGAVSIVARLEVRYAARSCHRLPHPDGSSELSASITEGVHQSDFACSVAPPATPDDCAVCEDNTTLTLELSVIVGVPFDLQWRARGSSSSNSQEVFAQFFFDLPPGYAIESRQGYSSGAVPAERVTWGRMKAIYR